LTEQGRSMRVEIVSALVAGLIRLWFATCRVRSRDQGLHDFVRRQYRGIVAFWHYSFIFILYHLRNCPGAAMVSASRDGAYVARVLERFGKKTVRGSSHRRGMQALLQMIRLVRQGEGCAIVADGSQGPARRAQPGAILLACKSGEPIYPVAWAATCCLRFNSWDQTLVPLPFSTVVVRCGPPLTVPPDITEEGVEQYRLELEARLNRAYEAAWNELGLPPHDQ
jgi:lysophospholipid acyltransferase (LPLAT)-like uncharacterized protein